MKKKKSHFNQTTQRSRGASKSSSVWRRLVASLGIAIFAAPTFTGCGGEKILVGPKTDYPTSTFSLLEIEDCASDADDKLRASLIAAMNTELDQTKEWFFENERGYCYQYYTPFDGDLKSQAGTVSRTALDTAESAAADDGASTSGTIQPPTIEGASKVANDSSKTNNQVDGVDEADLVKHDGKHIFVVDGEGFKVIDAFHGNDPSDITKAEIIADVKIDGQPKKLLLEDNRLVIFVAVDRESDDDQYGWYYKPRECTYGYNCDFTGDGTDTRIEVYNVEDPSKPELVRELANNGALLASRKIGKAVFVALSHPQPTVDDLAYGLAESIVKPYRLEQPNDDYTDGGRTPALPPSDVLEDVEEGIGSTETTEDGSEEQENIAKVEDDETRDDEEDDNDGDMKVTVSSEDDYEIPSVCEPLTDEVKDVLSAEFEAVRAENIKKIKAADLTTFRPTIADKNTEGEQLQLTTSCLSSPLEDGGQFTSVISFNIADADQAVDQDVIISKPGAIYVSDNALYMAVRHYQDDQWGWFEDEQSEIPEELSTIHKFSLDADTARSTYVASGSIEGYVLNQFAMDQHKQQNADGEDRDYLRIASTSGEIWQEGVHAQLTVLEEQNTDEGQALVEVGKLDQIAAQKAEDIRAVRFLGDRGYIVTFKQIDPLFAFDLSDPTAPEEIADIEVTGFSTYLHPLDENHLLSVGYESDAEDIRFAGQIQGIKLQVFDVSQAANADLPKDERIKAVHTKTIGTHGSASEALSNHLAFTLYRGKTLALPLTVCEDVQVDDQWGDYVMQEPTFSGLRLFDVTTADGFSKVGDIHHDGALENLNCWGDWTNSESAVRRTVFLEDVAFAIAGDQVIVDHIDALDDNKTKKIALSVQDDNDYDGKLQAGGGLIGIGSTEPGPGGSATQNDVIDQTEPNVAPTLP